MENFFAIRHPLLTRKILLKKNNRHSEKIITSCNLTRWGLDEIRKIENIPLSEIINDNL